MKIPIPLFKLPLSLRKKIFRIISKYNSWIPDKYYLINYQGGKIYLNLRESHMMKERFLGFYELEKINLFKQLVKPNMTIIDIGANKGYFTFLSIKLMKGTGMVYSIEPDPENCSWIKKSIKANNSKNVRPSQLAIYNENGFTNFFKGNFSGQGTLIKDMGFGSTMVKTIKLDDFIKEKNIVNVDLIKIDVEGAEIKVLEGASKLLQQKNLKIIMDIHDIDRKKLFDLLTKNKFNLYKYNLEKIEKIDEVEFLKKDVTEIYIQN